VGGWVVGRLVIVTWQAVRTGQLLLRIFVSRMIDWSSGKARKMHISFGFMMITFL
jgi:hypothetical protein